VSDGFWLPISQVLLQPMAACFMRRDQQFVRKPSRSKIRMRIELWSLSPLAIDI